MAETRDTTVSTPPKRYRNAASVLPPELLRELRKHHRGILYVGRSPFGSGEREDLVIQLRREGVPIREIARTVEVSARRVQQILATARARGIALPRPHKRGPMEGAATGWESECSG